MTGDPRPSAGLGSADSESPAGATSVAPPSIDTAFGQAVWLMMNMPQYKHVFLCDLEWMLLPPILLNQYTIFRADTRVVGFAGWAYLSEEAEARLQEPNPRLAPADWKSGDRLWVVNLFAPFGHGDVLVKELQTTALAGRRFKTHQRRIGGQNTVLSFES